ncbi:MAG: hypothetical protein FK732_01060 [Asgard group archaeon]|nr:hypothetical protein [Asgard group archaeon]
MLTSATHDALFWLYFFNALLLIIHEIDSAYWKEWELFKLPGGITGFLIIHFPLIGAILIGLIAIILWPIAGIVFSFILSFGGIFAFTIHTYFIKKGREEFTTPISKAILIAILVISVVQIAVTIVAILT